MIKLTNTSKDSVAQYKTNTKGIRMILPGEYDEIEEFEINGRRLPASIRRESIKLELPTDKELQDNEVINKLKGLLEKATSETIKTQLQERINELEKLK